MTPLEDFIGQERAMRAIQFGLGVNKPGFNIFVMDLLEQVKPASSKSFSKRSSPIAFRPMPILRSPRIGVTSTILRIRIGSGAQGPPRVG
jgi:hypothetical protein